MLVFNSRRRGGGEEREAVKVHRLSPLGETLGDNETEMLDGSPQGQGSSSGSF